jgi:hypothetical protein
VGGGAVVVDSSVIKEAVTLSEVIGQYVQLRQSGGNQSRFIGLCPFHNERNPSFCVDDSWGRYKCFSCSAKGDLIQFIQDYNGLDFKEAIKQAKVLAGIQDDFMTPSQKKLHEAKMKDAARERAAFRKWRDGLRANLICYTSLEWEIHRKARRQLMDTWTQELEEQSELAYSEAFRKEQALEQLESMTDNELMGYFRTQRTWEGVMNPPWFLSGRRLEMVKKARG